MQTRLADFIRDTPQGAEARAILQSCVHCGFCTATCPTYQLLGDELDGPRGRIYLIKQMLEGEAVSGRTQRHLDRCLTCRACETTCPSGVRYGRLLDIGRAVSDEKVARPWRERILRYLLRAILPHRARFAAMYRLACATCPLLPQSLRELLPAVRRPVPWPMPRHRRRMLLLAGCVQPVLAPAIDAATAQVLDRLGISLITAPGGGCCGALSHHLGAHREGLNFMRRNIDAWWPSIVSGVEAIVTTASGCGVLVKEYGHLLSGDPQYAEKARRVSGLARDLVEVLAQHDCSGCVAPQRSRLAFHSPCTLQHGQRLGGAVERLLSGLGFTLTPVADAHLCCGSAGTYSLLQPELSRRLRTNRIAALEAGHPDLIVTANIGCLLYLQAATATPVRHWIEVVAANATPGGGAVARRDRKRDRLGRGR